MDDEDIVCQVALSMLEHLGYEAEAFPDGESAVEAYRRSMEAGEPFDLVIMDLTVPGGLGGAEATRRILEIDPSARAIVSSGYSESPVMSSYRNYGFRGVMEKPYSLGRLKETVSSVLQD
jgi:CheY-like chemotaxis protein